MKVNENITITQGDIPEIVKSCHRRLELQLKKLGHRRGLTMPMFMAVPGSGKTSIGAKLADDLERLLFEDCAGNMMPGDARIPAVDLEKQIAMYCGNKSYPFINTGTVKEDDKVLMLWDEFLDASPIIQKILKQATEANRLGDLRFAENTLHIAMTNGLEHACNSERLGAAMANRTGFFEVAPSVDVFQEWFTAANINVEAEALIASNTDMFYNIKFATWDGKSNFASFRTVTEMGMMFEADYVTEEQDGSRTFDFKSDPLCRAKLQSILGQVSGTKAYAWLQLYDAIGSIERILANPTTSRLPDDISKQWIVAVKLVGVANESNLGAVMEIATRLRGSKSFLEAFVARSIGKQKPNLQKEPALRSWMARELDTLSGRSGSI